MFHLPRGRALGEDVEDVLPLERAELPFLDIKVAGCTPILGADASAVDVLAAQRRVQRSEGLSDRAILLQIQEMASPCAHLALGFFDEEGFGGAEKGGALNRANGGDMAGDECVVGGGDDGIHNRWC